MVSLPLPILTFVLSAVACALVWRLDIGNRAARGFFTAVFVLIATGTLLIGLRFGYGVETFIVIQRVIPLFIGPCIYLGFVALMDPKGEWKRRIALHRNVAICAALLPQLVPALHPMLDLLIGASYLFYSIAVLMLWRQGADSLTQARLELVEGLRQWMLAAVALLVVMLVFDTGIAISFAFERREDAVRLISYGSTLSLLSMVLAIVLFARARPVPQSKSVETKPDDGNTQLEQAARELLEQSKLYLDTELTLERLAKRLHVPARALSEAINQTQGMNVSQYVNGFRLRHAADLLATSPLKVTQVMEQSGFLTRSNFYREFERVFATSPTQYRRERLYEHPN